MTKNQLFKEFKVAVQTRVINGRLYTITSETLNQDFEDFYSKFSNVIKLSNIDSIIWIVRNENEDEVSISYDSEISIYAKGIIFTMKHHFLATKTSSNIKYYIENGQFKFFKEYL